MKKEEPTMLGKIIDLSLEDFERELKEQKVNIGTINNLILNLESVYFELRGRKEAILDLILKGVHTKDDPEVEKCLNGLYAEMTKVEQKITYLKQRSKELVDVDNTINWQLLNTMLHYNQVSDESHDNKIFILLKEVVQ